MNRIGFFGLNFLNCVPDLNDNSELSFKKNNAKNHILNFEAESGITCGEMLSFGFPDLSADQRSADDLSTVWNTGVLDSDLDLFGFPVLKF